MFGFFRKKEPRDRASGAGSAQEEAMKSVIRDRKKTDPLAGVKIGAADLNQRLINMLKNAKGVHIESFLTVLGSLAGFSCQMAAREKIAKMGDAPREKNSGAVALSNDGKKYYFGGFLNQPLAGSQYSVIRCVSNNQSGELTLWVAEKDGKIVLPTLSPVLSP